MNKISVMSYIRFQFLFLILINLFNSLSAQVNYKKQWPQFRGPYATGIIDSIDLPDTWNIFTGENIKWKIEIPGLGHSCPVIWENKLFVTTAISGMGTDSLKVGLYGDIDEVNDRSVHEFKVFCIEKNTGKILWENRFNRLAGLIEGFRGFGYSLCLGHSRSHFRCFFLCR